MLRRSYPTLRAFTAKPLAHSRRISLPRRTALTAAIMTDFAPPPVFADHRASSTSSTGGGAVQEDHGQTKVTSHNQYHTAGLVEADMLPSPLALFQAWFTTALQSGQVHEPEAMLLCTSTAPLPSSADAGAGAGMSRPSSRVVLLKSIHPTEGLTFYTNYSSRKAQEIAQNPYVSATFYWRETHQSVRFLGRARKVSREESQEYFDSRPLGSRIGAHASPQSGVIASREELVAMVKAKEQEFGVPGAAGLDPESQAEVDSNAKIPVPDHWGGYRIEPFEVEFWCGRPNRLHDRFR